MDKPKSREYLFRSFFPYKHCYNYDGKRIIFFIYYDRLKRVWRTIRDSTGGESEKINIIIINSNKASILPIK